MREEKNQSSKLFLYYFHINKRHGHILLVDDVKNDDRQGQVTRDMRQDILQNLSWGGVMFYYSKIISHNLSNVFVKIGHKHKR